MKSEELPLFLEVYRFVGEILTLVEKLPRNCKYTLGDKLIKESLELFEYVQLANSTLFKDGKKGYIEKFIIKFSLVKVLLRLCIDRKYITFKQHALLLPYIDSIGKQSTAWKKSIRGSREISTCQSQKSESDE